VDEPTPLPNRAFRRHTQRARARVCVHETRRVGARTLGEVEVVDESSASVEARRPADGERADAGGRRRRERPLRRGLRGRLLLVAWPHPRALARAGIVVVHRVVPRVDRRGPAGRELLVGGWRCGPRLRCRSIRRSICVPALQPVLLLLSERGPSCCDDVRLSSKVLRRRRESLPSCCGDIRKCSKFV
jgi:hypothetical protein